MAGMHSDFVFDYEDAIAFSNFNSLAVTASKQLQAGLALTRLTRIRNAIDNASSINAAVPVVAQNWQNVRAEEGNSTFDIRQQVMGSFLYELPLGPNRAHLSSGDWISHGLGGWSVSGIFVAAAGFPLSPSIAASVTEVARGTHGSVRPNRVKGSRSPQAEDISNIGSTPPRFRRSLRRISFTARPRGNSIRDRGC